MYVIYIMVYSSCLHQYAVIQKDGSKLNSNRRQITATGTEQSMSGRTTTFETKFIIGDDGIGHFQYTPKPDGQFITIEVSKFVFFRFSRNLSEFQIQIYSCEIGISRAVCPVH